MTATDSFNPLRTIPIGTTADGMTVTADRYEDDPPVVAVLDPQRVAREYTPDGARDLGQLLIAGADMADIWTEVPS